MELLSLPPKFALYHSIKTADFQCFLSFDNTKLRWTNTDKQGNENENLNHTNGNQGSSSFFNTPTKQFDISKLKVTELPYNPSVMYVILLMK